MKTPIFATSLPDVRPVTRRASSLPADHDLTARVDVFHAPRDAAPAWRVLEAAAPASPYQTMAWIEAWCATVGMAEGITPAIIVASNAAGEPTALLPFGYARRAGLRTGCFLGGTDSNCNLGLFDPRFPWDAAAAQRLLRSSGRRDGIDLFVLRNQPAVWAGRPNVLLPPQRQPSPSWSRKASLARDPDVFLAGHLSKHARKLLRQKENKLRALGPVTHRIARTTAEVAATLNAYFQQKSARFDAMGIRSLERPEVRHFLDAASDPTGGMAPVELHALMCGDEIVATFGGAGHAGHFSGMIVSFDQRPDYARCSPGDLLLAAVIADLCRRDFGSFDLGIGEARYKETFCDEVEPLFDSIVGLSAAGRCAAPVWTSLTKGKRSLKQSTWAWPLLLRLRSATANAQGERR